MAGGNGAEAEQRGGDGNLLRFGEGDDFALGAGFDDAVAGEDDGFLRLLDEFDSFADGV